MSSNKPHNECPNFPVVNYLYMFEASMQKRIILPKFLSVQSSPEFSNAVLLTSSRGLENAKTIHIDFP